MRKLAASDIKMTSLKHYINIDLTQSRCKDRAGAIPFQVHIQ